VKNLQKWRENRRQKNLYDQSANHLVKRQTLGKSGNCENPLRSGKASAQQGNGERLSGQRNREGGDMAKLLSITPWGERGVLPEETKAEGKRTTLKWKHQTTLGG